MGLCYAVKLFNETLSPVGPYQYFFFFWGGGGIRDHSEHVDLRQASSQDFEREGFLFGKKWTFLEIFMHQYGEFIILWLTQPAS